jgi:hypothetical protein
MHDDVVCLQLVDLERIMIRHELKVAVAFHSTFWLAGSSGCIKEPRDIVLVPHLVAISRIAASDELFI